MIPVYILGILIMTVYECSKKPIESVKAINDNVIYLNRRTK